MKKIIKNIILILFIIYCIVLVLVMFYPNLHHPHSYGQRYNLIPFATIYEMIRRLAEQTINADIVFKNIGVNILMFIPMGLALPILFKRTGKFWIVLLICLASTVFIEIVQYIFRLGSFDVDDIILNTLGGILGFGIIRIHFIWRLLVDSH